MGPEGQWDGVGLPGAHGTNGPGQRKECSHDGCVIANCLGKLFGRERRRRRQRRRKQGRSRPLRGSVESDVGFGSLRPSQPQQKAVLYPWMGLPGPTLFIV